MVNAYHFEVYLMGDSVTAGHWEKLCRAVAKQGGLLGSLELTFMCTDNVVRFFVSSPIRPAVFRTPDFEVKA